MPDGSLRKVEEGGDMSRALRDTERDTLRGASEPHPLTSFLSTFAGDVASDAGLSALGVPLVSTPYQVASGALSGLMGSDAELTGDTATSRDAASALVSTGIGAGLGYTLPKVGAAVARHLGPGIMSRARQYLEDVAVKQGRRVLLNGADALAGNKELPGDVVREALESGAIRPFGTTQSAYEALEGLAEARGANYGEILQRLQAAGVEGPNVEGLARQFSDEAADRWANSGANKSISQVFVNEADNVRAVAPPEFRFVVDGQPVPGPARETLPLNQAERIKRTLQDEARWDRLRLTGLDEAKQQVSSTYRQSIEDAIAQAGDAAPPGSEVAELASEFLPVKQQLARTLGARDAAERGTAAAAKRRGISLTDYLSAGAAAGGGPAMQLLAAAGNNFARNRGTSAVAAGAYGASRVAGGFARPDAAEGLGNTLGAAFARQLAGRAGEKQDAVPRTADYRRLVLSNPAAFGPYAERLQRAAEEGPQAFDLQDYMMAQSDPEYAAIRKRALQQASGEPVDP